MPFILVKSIYYNRTSSFKFSQQEEIKNKLSSGTSNILQIYISRAYYQDIDISLNLQIEKVVPLGFYFGIMNLIKSNKAFHLNTADTIFSLVSFVFFIILSFFALDYMKSMDLTLYRDYDNWLFLFSLIWLMFYIFFGTFLFKNRVIYYKEIRNNKFKTNMVKYRLYYLIDYVIDGRQISYKDIVYELRKNKKGTLRYKKFIAFFIPLIFGVYASLAYNKIYTVDVIDYTQKENLLKEKEI